MIELSKEDLPDIESWEEGQTYEVTLTVTQASPSRDGSAQFSVEQAQGRPADRENQEPETSEEQSENGESPNFKAQLSEQMDRMSQEKNGGKPSGR